MATQPGRSRSTRGAGRTTDFETAEVGGTESTSTTAAHADAGSMSDATTDQRSEAGSRPARGNGTSGWTGVLKNAATSRISDQKHKASEGIDQVARALRDTTDRMQQQGGSAIADYARQAAEQLERFSRRLDEQDLDELMRGAQRLARTQPWLFVGAAFGLGLFAARFFKSSNTSSYRGDDEQWRSVGGTTYTAPMTTPSLESSEAYGIGPTS